MIPELKRAFKDDLFEQFARIGGALANGHRIELLDVPAQAERSVEFMAQDLPAQPEQFTLIRLVNQGHQRSHAD